MVMASENWLELLRVSSANPMTAAVTAAIIFSAGFYFSRVTGRRRRKRALSFSSDCLINGAFPPKSKVQQPIISTLFYMNNMPPLEKVAEKMSNLFQYDRMRSGSRDIGGKIILNDLGRNVDAVRDLVETLTFPNEDKIREAVDNLCDMPMELAEHKLLWRVYRMVNEGEGRSAIYVRVHHVIGDGIALVSIMQKIFEKENGDPFQLEFAEKMRSSDKSSKFGIVFKLLRSVFEVAILGMSKYDTNTAFCPEHSTNLAVNGRRKNIEFPVIKLEVVKEIKNRAKVTVNDVLMAAFSGMVRKYCVAKNDPNIRNIDQKTNIQMRALLPIAFPRPKKDLLNPAKALRNYWSFVSAPMTVNETTSKDRVFACAKVTKQLKKSPNALVQLFLQDNVMSLAPQFLQRQIAHDVFSRHSVVFSNLPGPADRIAFCGEPVRAIHIIFPNLIPQVILISYCGGIYLTLCADPEEVDAELLCRCFHEEIVDMANSFGMEVTAEDVLFRE